MAEGKYRISRPHALAIFLLCGWKSSAKWDNETVAEKMPQIKDVYSDQQPTDETVAKVLVDVLAAIEAGTGFEVFNPEGVTSPEATPKKPEKTEEEKAAEKAAKEKEKTASQEAKKAEREKAKDAKKAEREAAKAKKKEEREAKKAAKKAEAAAGGPKGRGYFAGAVVKKYGMANGITDEMITEVDKLYGKANRDVSKGALNWAFQALEGFNDQEAGNVKANVSDAPAAPAAA